MVYGVVLVVCAVIAWKWVTHMDNMKSLHPEYEGEDFL